MLAAGGVWSLKPLRPSHRVRSRPASGWTRASWVVDALVVAVFLLAMVVTVSGGVKFRSGSQVLFSAREPLRQWLQLAALVGIRVALVRRVPLDIGGRWRRFAERLFSVVRLATPGSDHALRADRHLRHVAGHGTRVRPLQPRVRMAGFSFIRVPSRFMILTLLALAVLAGSAFDRWTAGAAPKRRILLAAIVGLLLAGEFASFPSPPFPITPIFRPSIDGWTRSQNRSSSRRFQPKSGSRRRTWSTPPRTGRKPFTATAACGPLSFGLLRRPAHLPRRAESLRSRLAGGLARRGPHQRVWTG